MKNYIKNYLIFVILISVLIAPSFALASWYNPFSWHIWSDIWTYIFQKPTPTTQQTTPTACTQEAKLCSDGSFVGRTGPKCEFAPCPTTPDPTADWKTYKNEKYGFEMKYPSDFKISDTYDFLHTGNPTFLLKDKKSELFSWSINVESSATMKCSSYVKPGQNRVITDITVGEIKVKKIQIFSYPADGGPYTSTIICLEKGDSTYLLSCNHSGEPKDYDYTLFNKMLSTFKFINITIEQSCINSGGKISTIQCCFPQALNFPERCGASVCSRPPQWNADQECKTEIKVCDCEEGKCFDGYKCVPLTPPQ